MPDIVTFTVNGAERTIDAPLDEPLLQVLRDRLGLTGCKIGCGEGACGACSVLVEGQLTRSCITPLGEVAGKQVLTIEGIAAGDQLHPLQQAFLDAGAFQCGYCTAGMIMAGVALLSQQPDPSEDAIVQHMQGNICRCGMYARIVQAIRQAASELHPTPMAGGER